MLDNTPNNIDRLLLWTGNSALVMALLTGVGAAWMFTSYEPTVPSRPSVIVTTQALAQVSEDSNDLHMPFKLRQFALNALLAPLIDDADPARWTDMALNFMCDSETRLLVNGSPMVVGALVPTEAFSIRWDMNHCEPMGPRTPLSGGVVLLVSRDDSGMSALVIPDRLQVHGPTGKSTVSSPFTAKLSLVKSSADP